MAPTMQIGRGLGQQLMQELTQATILTEIVYSFVIILVSLMIYFSTKEFYELTRHKGIKYFRISFLLFAISIFFRSFIKIFVFFVGIPAEYHAMLRALLGPGAVFLFMYFSSLAIFYLVYSVKYKEWVNKNLTSLAFHVTALIIGLVVVLSNNSMMILIINLILLLFILFAILVSNENKTEKKQHSSLHIIYILLFVFWIFNVMDILIPDFFQFYKLIIYLSSIGIFLSILYKVLRNIGAK